jgi:gluconate 2-dehydrogenase gamma chain
MWTFDTDSAAPGPAPATDESENALSRRVFVRHISLVGGGVVLLGGCKNSEPTAPAPKAEAPSDLASKELTTKHLTFTNDEWTTLAAIVDRMLPSDEDPGALEADVPEYIDRMLQTPQIGQMKENFISGLAAIDRRSQRLHKVPFAKATAAQQDELLTIFKNSPEKSGEARWYEILVVLTLEGFLGDPSYGGNKNEVGWKLVGFELVGRNLKGDPPKGYDGSKHLQHLRCGDGKGC